LFYYNNVPMEKKDAWHWGGGIFPGDRFLMTGQILEDYKAECKPSLISMNQCSSCEEYDILSCRIIPTTNNTSFLYYNNISFLYQTTQQNLSTLFEINIVLLQQCTHGKKRCMTHVQKWNIIII
jgi:hypothetical protein